MSELQYLDHMRDIIGYGEKKSNRTGVDTRSLFGFQMRFNLMNGFPLLTTKKVFTKGIIYELLWFLNGDTNTKYLVDNGVHIWDEWANEDGDLGPVYGYQWRKWLAYDNVNGYQAETFDQISNAIDLLKLDPDSRRNIVSAWNVGQLGQMALQPCHVMFQFNTSPAYTDDGKRFLDLQLYQRSADWFIGVPFNIASYALLLTMVAQQVDMIPRHFIHSFGDTHLYVNHFEQAMTQLGRAVMVKPEITIKKAKDIFSYKFEDFEITGYNPHPAIKAEVAV